MRECWVRMFDTWVPYPFQNNIRYLPKEVTYECLTGLVEAQTKRDHKGREELQGVHGRRLRRRDRQALHEALQLQGLGASRRDDEQGMDRRARRRARHQPRDQERRARHRRFRLGPEQPVQVPALRRHRRVLSPLRQSRSKAMSISTRPWTSSTSARKKCASPTADRAEVRSAHHCHAARQALQRRHQRRDAARDQEGRRFASPQRRIHGRHRHQAAMPEHQVLDVFPRRQLPVLSRHVSVATIRHT